MKGKPFSSLKLREAIAFELRTVVVVNVVEPDDGFALGQQHLAQVEPDKAGGAGHEIFVHQNFTRLLQRETNRPSLKTG